MAADSGQGVAAAGVARRPATFDGRIRLKGVLLQVNRDGETWTTEEIWTTGHMRTKFTTPVVRDHYAYGLDDGVLTCIDLDDEGKPVWQAGRAGQPNHYGHGQVLLVEDLLMVQAESAKWRW